MTDFADLLARFGSPLYVYRLDRVRAALQDLRCALPDPSHLYFSLKANPHPDLSRELRQGGCRAEISSSGELTAAIEAGYPADECVYTGPAKTPVEIAAAISAGVRLFSVESLTDQGRVATTAMEQGRTVDCLLRVNTGKVSPSSLRMNGSSQFGTPIERLLRNPGRYVDRPGARVIGAHFFSQSNSRHEDALIDGLETSIIAAEQLRLAGIPITVVDLGGGFAAPHSMPGRRPRYPRLKTSLERLLDNHLPGWRRGDPSIVFESGRYLVGDCGFLIATVADLKCDYETTFVVLDSGIHHLGGMAGLGRVLRPAATPIPVDLPHSNDGDETVTLAGPLCTPADILGRDISFAQREVGDLVVFPNVGAYGLTASLLGFLSRPAPAELVLDGDRVTSATRLALTRIPVQAATNPLPSDADVGSKMTLNDASV